jgi:hypothetical protein
MIRRHPLLSADNLKGFTNMTPGFESDSDMRDQHLELLLAASKRFRNYALEGLEFGGSVYAVGEDGEFLTPIGVLKGSLWVASEVLVDELFEDLRAVEDAPESATSELWQRTMLLDELPERFRQRYDILFARKFVLVSAELTRRVCVEWQSLSCVAMELALDLLLDKVEVALESWGLDVDPSWRIYVEDALREDRDSDLLHGYALDGIEAEPDNEGTGIADQRFESWFTSFNGRPNLPPYC